MEKAGKHILVVDDDWALRTLYQGIVKKNGYTSDSAKHGEEAITKLELTSYDAVLLDYKMPGMSGLTVLQHIQQHYPFTPVVMITGQIGEQISARALSAGARACLYKPFSCKEFEDVLNGLFTTLPIRALVSGNLV